MAIQDDMLTYSRVSTSSCIYEVILRPSNRWAPEVGQGALLCHRINCRGKLPPALTLRIPLVRVSTKNKLFVDRYPPPTVDNSTYLREGAARPPFGLIAGANACEK